MLKNHWYSCQILWISWKSLYLWQVTTPSSRGLCELPDMFLIRTRADLAIERGLIERESPDAFEKNRYIHKYFGIPRSRDSAIPIKGLNPTLLKPRIFFIEKKPESCSSTWSCFGRLPVYPRPAHSSGITGDLLPHVLGHTVSLARPHRPLTRLWTARMSDITSGIQVFMSFSLKRVGVRPLKKEDQRTLNKTMILPVFGALCKGSLPCFEVFGKLKYFLDRKI